MREGDQDTELCSTSGRSASGISISATPFKSGPTGWQNWTVENLATKLTKDDQQPVWLLPARWWPDTLPEFESGGWWQNHASE